MHEKITKAQLGEQIVEYSDTCGDVLRAIKAFCENRSHMTSEEAREVLESLKLVRSMAMVFRVESAGEPA